MSDETQDNGTPKHETPPSSAPPGSEPIAVLEQRVPMDDPRVWARGKTVREILGLTEQTASYAQGLAAQVQQAHKPDPQPRFDPTQIRDDDFIDGKTLKNYLSTAAQPFNQRFENVYGNIAQQNLETVRNQYAEVFKRYGDEIMPLIHQMPLDTRTIDNLKAVVHLVRGQHFEDEEKRIRDELTGDPTLRGGQSASSAGRTGSTVGSDELPADYRQLLKEKGVTDEVMREFFASQNMGPDKQREWFELAKKHKTNVITERSRRG